MHFMVKNICSLRALLSYMQDAVWESAVWKDSFSNHGGELWLADCHQMQMSSLMTVRSQWRGTTCVING